MSQEEQMDSVRDTDNELPRDVDVQKIEKVEKVEEDSKVEKISLSPSSSGPAAFSNLSTISSSRGTESRTSHREGGSSGNSGNNLDKSAKRTSLRSKFEQFLKESKQEDNNARYEEALERLKKEKDAEEFNLVCRQKGDQKTGLIILNKLARKRPAEIPVSKVVKEAPAKPVKVKMSSNPEEEEMSTETPIPEPAPVKRVAVPKPPRQPRRVPAESRPIPPSKKAATEQAIMGLANQVKSLEQTIERMKRKKEDKKLHKEAKRSIKAQMHSKEGGQEKRIPKTRLEKLYAVLEERSPMPSARVEKPIDIFKRLY